MRFIWCFKISEETKRVADNDMMKLELPVAVWYAFVTKLETDKNFALSLLTKLSD
jgi:hypothetical protein